jgi:hypothetical protein
MYKYKIVVDILDTSTTITPIYIGMMMIYMLIYNLTGLVAC